MIAKRTLHIAAMASVLATFVAACGGGGSGSSANNDNTSSPVGAVTDADSSENSVLESAPVGTAVGITARAVDPDPGDSVTYALSDNAGGLFSIAENSGEVALAGQIDFETTVSHDIRVQARSTDGSVSSTTFTIAVIDDTTELQFALSFPVSDASAVAHFTGTELDFSGTIVDPTGGQPTVEVTDGNTTTQATVNANGQWRAENVPINQVGRGIVDLQVMARSDSGQVITETISISTQILLQQPSGITVDAATQRAYVLDRSVQSLYALDVATGDRTLVADSLIRVTPAGTEYWPERLAVDVSSNNAYVRVRNEILRVDLTTGDQFLFSDLSPAMGPVPDNPTAEISVDGPGNRLIVGSDDELIAIDLTTGLRTVLSGSGRGSGPGFEALQGVVVADNNRVLVANLHRGLYSVDLSSGDRTVVSDATTGSGPLWDGNLYLAFDQAGNRAIVVGPGLGITFGDVFAVDLTTGDRTDITGSTVGQAPGLTVGMSVAWHVQTGRALIAARIHSQVLAVSPNTGLRSVLSGNDVTIGSGEELGQGDHLAADLQQRRAFYGPSATTIAEINLDTGERQLLFNQTTGTGPGFQGTGVKVYDPQNELLYLNTGSGLLSLDLSTGNRTLVSDPPLINGPPLGSAWDLVIDRSGSRILAAESADRFAPTVLAIDLGTGLRSTLSGPANGVGPDFQHLSGSGIVLDEAFSRVLVPDVGTPGLIAADIGTGDRTVVVDFLNSVPQLRGVRRIGFDPISRRCFAVDRNLGLYEIDLLSGQITEVSGANVGEGQAFDQPLHILLDIDDDRAFVSDDNGIHIVDLVNGDRVLFAN